ncbi:putative toxin-antitoxin system toxin component, PIN family, partial [Candidatus Poribacteria bacterium]|nr:putative toxin-antitoxin system toxin component, PIN family [Candidatus Poribacteria bacterium]
MGELGRIVLQGRPDGRTHVTCEVVGDADDPMTEKRAAIFKPLGIELTRQLDMATGGTGEGELVPLTPGTSLSAFLAKTKENLSSALFRLCMIEGILCTAEEILEETRSVLLEKEHIRSKYSYLDHEFERFIELIREKSNVAEQMPDIKVIERDPSDNMIIACAVACQASYIVSRDLDLLDFREYKGIKILKPEEFIH